MASSQFEPIFPAHAIERCSATVLFDQPLPTKLFERTRLAQEARLGSLGFERGPKTIGFSLDFQTGRVLQVGDDAQPVPYTTHDRSLTITILSSQVSLQTIRYVRWAQFRAALDKYLIPTVADFSASVSIAASQLDYIDRFWWTGTWVDFEASALLNMRSDLFAHRPGATNEQWHSHSGWFQRLEPGIRRLVNVNIDVVSAQVSNVSEPRPSVGILTSMRDATEPSPPQITPSGIPDDRLLSFLDRQHVDLKGLLRDLLVQEMTKKIGL